MIFNIGSERISELKEENNALQIKISKLENNLENICKKMDSYHENIIKLERENVLLNQAIYKLMKEFEKKDEFIETLNDSVESLKINMNDIKAEIIELNSNNIPNLERRLDDEMYDFQEFNNKFATSFDSTVKKLERHIFELENIVLYDEELLRRKISRDGRFLIYSKSIGKDNDKSLVSLAVKNNPSSLQYASIELKSDAEFILYLCDICNQIEHRRLNEAEDKSFIYEKNETFVYKKNEELFPYISEELKENYDFLCSIAAKNGMILKYVNNEQLIDENLAAIALKNSILCIDFIPTELFHKEDFVHENILKRVESEHIVLKYLPKELLENIEFAKKVVKLDGEFLEYLPVNLQDDEEFVQLSIKDNYKPLKFASERLKRDKDFITGMIFREVQIDLQSDILQYGTDDCLRNDQNFMEKICIYNRSLERFASSNLKKKFEFQKFLGYISSDRKRKGRFIEEDELEPVFKKNIEC